MLDAIIETKREELKNIDQDREIKTIKEVLPDLPPTRSLKRSICKDYTISIIAEIKRRSPSRGVLIDNLRVDKMVSIYEESGASAISVLTEGRHFGGSTDDLKIARANTTLPVLRKDLILEEYQVWESRYIGADAILLIVGIMPPKKLNQLYLTAELLELEVLFEVHTEKELEALRLIHPQIIGINNRNLKTFEVDLETSETLAPTIPPHIIRVTESGIHSRDDIIRMEECCLDAALIGEGIITNAYPGDKIRELLGIR